MEIRRSNVPVLNSFLLIMQYYCLKLLRDLFYRLPLSYYCLLIDVSESILSSCENRKKKWGDYLQLIHTKEHLTKTSVLHSLKTMLHMVAAPVNCGLERVSYYISMNARYHHRLFMIRFMNQIERGSYLFMSIPEIKRKAFCYLPV